MVTELTFFLNFNTFQSCVKSFARSIGMIQFSYFNSWS